MQINELGAACKIYNSLESVPCSRFYYYLPIRLFISSKFRSLRCNHFARTKSYSRHSLNFSTSFSPDFSTRSLLIVDGQSQIYFSICSTARPRPVYVLELFSPRNRSDWVVIRWYSLTIIFNGYNWTIRNPRLARPLTRHREKKIIFVRLRSHSFLRFPPSFQTYLRFRVPFKSLLFIYL